MNYEVINAGVSFQGLKVAITDTASAGLTSYPFAVSGGAAGTTNWFRIRGADGLMDFGGNGIQMFSFAAVFNFASTGRLQWSNPSDLTVEREAAANLRLGGGVSGTPIAQTLSVQNASGTNINGVDRYFDACRSTGTGTGGSHVFRTTPAGTTGTTQGTLTAALTIDHRQKTTFAGYTSDAGQSRVSSQFDKTDDTLANITGLSVNVTAGKTYCFYATLYTTANVAGGVKAAIAGTATATSIIYEGITTAAAGLAAQTRATALGTEVGGATTATAGLIRIDGTITVNAGGTLTVQFAQNASNGAASSVLVGSTFIVEEF